MFAGPPDWNEIRGDLLIGSCPWGRESLAFLRRLRVTAVLSLQHAECHRELGIDPAALGAAGAELGLVMIQRPMRDFDPPDQMRRLPGAVRALHELLKARHRVYLHCTAGINRSPLVALGQLSFVEGLSPEAAIAEIQRRRPRAAPSWEAYWGCQRALVETHARRVAQRAAMLRQAEPSRDEGEIWRAARAEVVRWAIVGA
jgi:hypothetical protein